MTRRCSRLSDQVVGRTLRTFLVAPAPGVTKKVLRVLPTTWSDSREHLLVTFWCPPFTQQQTSIDRELVPEVVGGAHVRTQKSGRVTDTHLTRIDHAQRVRT